MKNRKIIRLAAVNKYIDKVMVEPTERKNPSKEFVEWGTNNLYPEYLLSLYKSVSTLHSIINGMVEYITGDNIAISPLRGYDAGVLNVKGDTITTQVRELAKDYGIFGGFALQVIRGRDGKVSEIYALNMANLRSNKENDVFFYCEEWGRAGRKKVVVYPAFLPNLEEKWSQISDQERNNHASSVLFVKNVNTQTYPAPLYAASLKACEIERQIDTFHLNAINNGFTGSYVINFNNGVPEDEVMDEIERDFNDKFSGAENAGRIAYSWNNTKDTATTIEKIDVEDFGEKYNSLEKHSRQQIFTAFRANPNLFGIPTDSLGFSAEEYESAFKLFNRTMIKPVQKRIVEAYEKVFGKAGVMIIKPFSLEGDVESIVQ